MSANKDIGFALKTALEGYAATPQNNAWAAIEAELKRQRRRRIIGFILLGAMVLLVAILIFLSFGQEVESSKKPSKIEVNPLDNKEISTQNDSLDISTKKINATKAEKQTKETESLSPKKLNSVKGNQTHSLEKKELHSAESKTVNPSTANPKSIASKSDASNTGSIVTPVTEDKTEYHSDGIEKGNAFRMHTLLRLDAKRLDSAAIKIDSIQLKNFESLKDSINTDAEENPNWSLFSYVSLDRYNAFGQTVTDQSTFNTGIFLSHYPFDRLALRVGFRRLDLQYNFQNNERQQQVQYSEIPVEARYFITHKSKLKTSLILGGSYLFLQEATLIDMVNNTTRDNRNLYNRNIFSYTAGLGLHYQLNKHWQVNLESWFKYHPAPFTRNQGFTPYNLSLSFGVEYKFYWK